MIKATLEQYSGYQSRVQFHGDYLTLKQFVKNSSLYSHILSTNENIYNDKFCYRK